MKSSHRWVLVRARLSQFAEKVDAGQVLVNTGTHSPRGSQAKAGDRPKSVRSARPVRLHTFCHSAASFINALTGNLKLARKLLGHATIDTTAEVYTHSSAEAGREAALAVELAIYGDSFPNLFPIENSSRAASINRY